MPFAPERLRAIRDFPGLLAFLAEVLHWPLPEDPTPEDVTFDWDADEIQLPAAAAERLQGGLIRQLRPLHPAQPWGVFFVEFNEPRLYRTALRQILRRLVPNRRRDAAQRSWRQDDLLFICATRDYREITFAHFRGGDAGRARLASFGWNRDDPRGLRTLREFNLPPLAYPAQPADPAAWAAQWARAFDVEPVTREFFRVYKDIFREVEAAVTGLPDPERRRLWTQRLFNRLMFIAFIEKKGWLTLGGRSDYLAALWETWQRQPDAAGLPFYNARLRLLFFQALNNPASRNLIGINGGNSFLGSLLGSVPYLNGGLFEEDADDQPAVSVPDAALGAIFTGLFARFNFTVTESTPLDVEVAVDPEMLGKVFEELVTGRHESGSYYTPKPIVAFMCREALKHHLAGALPAEAPAALANFVDAHDAAALADGEAVLRALLAVRVCDPACGSGAYLLGMLHELLDLRACLFATGAPDAASVHARKLTIIQGNLYGVDLDPFAVNIARLRLWLSLAVDAAEPLPLPNLDFKIEAGDSLAAPDPHGAFAASGQGSFRDAAVRAFQDAKAAYLSAQGDAKAALRATMPALRAEVAGWLTGPAPAGAFDWAVEFAEIFLGAQPSRLPGSGVGGQDARAPTLPGWHSRGYLPHFDAPGLVQSLTFRLHDSVPAHVIADWKRELAWREDLPGTHPARTALRRQLAAYEDAGHGACHLRDPRISALVDAALRHFDGERYRLLAWTLMPNHVHALIEPLPGHALGGIVHSWKSFTAKRANALLGRTGEFWSADYHDRFIRDEGHLRAVIDYIEQNPVKAGLATLPQDWPGSASVPLASSSPARSERDARAPGFDIVLANPPYVRQELIKAQKPTLKLRYECYEGTADLLVYFYERAVRMLRPGGTLAFISSNKFYRAGYGKKLRGFLARETSVQTLVDFGDAPVFGAIAYAAILVAVRTPPAPEAAARALNWKNDGQGFERIGEIVANTSQPLAQCELVSEGWLLESTMTLRLLEKLHQSGKPLWEYLGGKTRRGITTGFNEAFVVDTAERQRLVAEHPSSTAVLKPFLRGKDVTRWSATSAGASLIKIESSANVDHPWSALDLGEAEHAFQNLLPAIQSRFAAFRPELIKRDDQGVFFWELRSCTYWADFVKPKIVSTKVSLRPTFALDTSGSYLGNTAYFLPANADGLFILALLNSRVFHAYAKNVFVEKQNGYYEVQPAGLDAFPIPPATAADQAALTALVDGILAAKRTGDAPTVRALEAEIDAHVFRLYGLTPEEQALVLAATA